VKHLIFDVETTGLPNYNLRARDPSQPHLVQFAAILMDGDTEVESFSAIVRPDGWVIPDEVAAIHGITTAIATELGIPEQVVTNQFLWWMREVDQLTAHNLQFDKFLMRIEARRYDLITDADGQWWSDFPCYCTMRNATELVRAPSKHGRGFKWPTLSETYKFAFGRELKGAHDALVDVRACAEIYQWLVGSGKGLVAPAPKLIVPTASDIIGG
jgi:DNA polymerase III epsilon subunit-like protein